MTQHPTWRLPAPQIRSYTPILRAYSLRVIIIIYIIIISQTATDTAIVTIEGE